MLRAFADVGDRNLVGAERPFDLQAVDDLGARPPLGRPQNDEGPARARFDAARAGFTLNRSNARKALVERGRERLVHDRRIIPLDEGDVVAVP